VLLAVVLGVLGGYGLGLAAQSAWESAAEDPAASVPPGGSSARLQRSAAQRAAAAALSPLAAPSVPAVGTGRFEAAAGTGARIGSRGRLVRFQILVEIVDGTAASVASGNAHPGDAGSGDGPPGSGAAFDPAAFGSAVERTLADGRSWNAAGQWSFQRVAAGDAADLVIRLTTPQTTDRLCGQYGLDTGGEVSCRGGGNIMINLKRWQLSVPWYADAIDEYRHMVINHEGGHFLGHGHSLCTGPGRQAAVMQTQTYGLEGCVRNPWPYPDGAHYLG